MNPETDQQLKARVLDPDLVRDDNEFITSDELTAYAHHLDSRYLVDTEANRATWIAARTYYDAEAQNDLVVELNGEHFTQAQFDMLLRWRDEKVSYGDKPATADAMIPASDLALRERALSFATGYEAKPDETVERAKTYLSFLQGGAE